MPTLQWACIYNKYSDQWKKKGNHWQSHYMLLVTELSLMLDSMQSSDFTRVNSVIITIMWLSWYLLSYRDKENECSLLIIQDNSKFP